MITVGFIGAGNMGYAIMKGAAESPQAANMSISAFDPDAEKCARLAEFGVTACASGREVLENCKYVFLAVKPQMFDVVLEE
ncbi:MAG: NAD(P)-binding domain-containing protein, partial [Oscillospiraceae bacterium]|nr:NAD(P)-binding domain-containing protein [Oscillospiraceae bacterium]